MIPKITSAGRSFKGAARYYLHDPKAPTAARVAFVETVNLPTDDPRRAVANMIDTATHAAQLKQAAGIKGGRPLQKPVYTFSLAWHPSERPTAAEQIEAAREALAALGMDDRQAVIVGHHDTDHPHVHVMVNRVCPNTGRAASNSDDRRKLSTWAEDYERRRGRIYCKERERNNAARRSGQWRTHDGESRPVWQEWKRAQTKALWDEHRAETANMRDGRKAQYEALWQQKQQRFATRRAEIKALYKPVWRDTFRQQEKALKNFDAGMFDRIGFAFTRRGGLFTGLLEAVIAPANLRHQFIQEQERERAMIAARQRQTIRDASREITKAYRYDRDTLRAAHKAQDQARYEETQAKTKEIWRQPASTPEQTARPEFEQTKDRRSPENQAKRDELQAAPEEAKKRARRSARDILREDRNRSRGRTRRRPR